MKISWFDEFQNLSTVLDDVLKKEALTKDSIKANESLSYYKHLAKINVYADEQSRAWTKYH